MAETEPGDGVDRRALLLSGLAVSGAIMATPLFPREQPAITSKGSDGLRARADRKGLLCGTAVSYEILTGDKRIRDNLIEDCNIIVPENELKWSRIQPSRTGPFAYRNAQVIHDFASLHNIAVRGTCLHWWNAQPAWAKAYIPTLSAAQAGDFLQNYVRKVAGDWKGRLVHWDVTNEEIDGKGNLIDTLFAPILGEHYIDLCFNAVRDTDPDTLRCYNINYVEQDTRYEDGMRSSVLRQLERLLHRGVPIQCVGIQSHLTTMTGFTEMRYRAFLDEITAMGLKLLVTEFDVSDRGTIGSVAVRDAATAALGKAYLDIMFSYPGCLGLLSWGPTDKYHWLRRVPEKQRSDRLPLRAAPLDDEFRRKPLWHAIAAAIDAAAPR